MPASGPSLTSSSRPLSLECVRTRAPLVAYFIVYFSASFNITMNMSVDISKTATCTSCRFKEDKSTRAGIFYQNGSCPSTHPVRIPLVFLETIRDTKPFLNDWPTDGTQPLVYSMGDPTGFGQHGDYVFGWEDDSHDRAMAHCNDRGDFPADCKELMVQTDYEINGCM
ncbi:hypothetical protein FA13DRAFT_1798057 [Coprinellus micaceus]|uniref:DUF1996 domain-containing protein n=1 Tax=Coprinellus micaceus TaxID=71717 RepID=A0A4Y7SNE1_COPMI|nr:hypothetical protein FA13DRAFT_1798057 [Coprinellus micaceus]